MTDSQTPNTAGEMLAATPLGKMLVDYIKAVTVIREADGMARATLRSAIEEYGEKNVVQIFDAFGIEELRLSLVPVKRTSWKPVTNELVRTGDTSPENVKNVKEKHTKTHTRITTRANRQRALTAIQEKNLTKKVRARKMTYKQASEKYGVSTVTVYNILKRNQAA